LFSYTEQNQLYKVSDGEAVCVKEKVHQICTVELQERKSLCFPPRESKYCANPKGIIAEKIFIRHLPWIIISIKT